MSKKKHSAETGAKSGTGTMTGPVAGIIILAAGQGKRMKSSLPKVLHSISGQPLLFHILDRVREAAPSAPVAIVVGHGREQVEAAVRSEAAFSKMDISFAVQKEQKGTGDAARSAMDTPWGDKILESKAPVLVLPGDLPLLPKSLIEQMLAPLGRGEALRLLTCELPDPTGYGRIVRRGKSGPVQRIVEEKDASIKEKTIREVAASIYCFQSSFLKKGLGRLSNKNAQGEFYLTDLISQASGSKKKIDVLLWSQPEDLRGVNDLWELAQAERILNERCVKNWAKQGVRFTDPWSTHVDVQVELAEGVVVQPGAVLGGKTKIGRGTKIGAQVVLKNMTVGEECHIKTGSVAEDSVIENRVNLGPYAHLRPESRVGSDAKIGNFVELKKASVGEHTSIAHLSYLGDAEVGRHVNIGCGFVTCNFDGRVINGARKHKTIIEDEVFMGSDCQAIAPVRIGKGSYVASGSTIHEDVEPGALAIARTRQVTKPGYAAKLKAKQKQEK
jgi:bifunctional UDP-N-acetylglucosamine pyrophosphorylase/glucosamine-1-phosphate N-acetyltransferase